MSEKPASPPPPFPEPVWPPAPLAEPVTAAFEGRVISGPADLVRLRSAAGRNSKEEPHP
jgi:hypothetical protein